ncbi:calpain cysteine peptidase [Angomonas deanei]|uniref:Calpain family cysteine protease, putative n=1 Tax=Angomonas deanei TaxID=59799 RepID=A0A7G2C6J7_9TRYP|nr:calpain cysteine peptidase [Angomonas deanei]CAD2215189.1 Calpain family cysteine protease, putative [Angomonas deanei]|eukprot:EPY17791.1 calpain cysteine peptidase [Angomonas deanei]
MGCGASFQPEDESKDRSVEVNPSTSEAIFVVPPIWVRSAKLTGISGGATKLFDAQVDGKVIGLKASSEVRLYHVGLKNGVSAVYNDHRNKVFQIQLVYEHTNLRALGDAKVIPGKQGTTTMEVLCFPMATTPVAKGNTAISPSVLNVISREPLMLCREYVKWSNDLTGKAEAHRAHMAELVPENKPELCVKHCLAVRKEQFVDRTFPEEYTSDGYVWARPCDYLPPRTIMNQSSSLTTVFGPSILPQHVGQGDLGDSWLVGAIAALAEDSSDVRRLFLHPRDAATASREQAIGAYRVALFVGGKWTHVLLDDYFPTLGNLPLFAKSTTSCRELWVSLLEKAFAKVYGGYNKLVSGDPLRAMEILTGCPTYRYDSQFNSLSSTKSFYPLLENYVWGGFPVLMSTPVPTGFNDKSDMYFSAGLPMGQVFRIIDLASDPNTPTGPIRLFRLRNVSGDPSVWAGKWRESSSNWYKYPSLAKQCMLKSTGKKFTNDDPYSFWVSWQELRRYFSGCGVVFQLERCYHYTIQNVFKKSATPAVCLLLQCDEEMQVGWGIELLQKGGAEPQALPISLVLYRAFLRTKVTSPKKTKAALKDDFDLEVCSSDDPWNPSKSFCFKESTKTSMFHRLSPLRSPFLLVPRVASESLPSDVKFSLSLWTTAPTQNLHVTLVSLPTDSEFFKNTPKAGGADAMRSTSAHYTTRPPGTGAIKEYDGVTLTPHGVLGNKYSIPMP